MPWIGGAIAAGGSLLAGAMGADAAGNAANVQANSASAATAAQQAMADKALSEQRRQFDLSRGDNAQFLATGTAANKRLGQLLGLKVQNQPTSSSGQGPLTADQVTQLYQRYLGRAPAQAEIDGQLSAGNQAWQLEQGFPTNGEYQSRVAQGMAPVTTRMYQQPVEATQTAAQDDGSTSADYGSLLKKFGVEDLNADPVYQSGLKFGLDRGTEGINARATAGGMYDSGATLKALVGFGNDYGSTKAAESRGRFIEDQNSVFNKLSGVSGTGQVAVGQSGAAGANYANNTSSIYGNLSNGVSNGITGAGNARAAGIVGGANAWAGAAQGVNSAYGNYNNSKILQALINKQTGGSSSWSPTFTES